MYLANHEEEDLFGRILELYNELSLLKDYISKSIEILKESDTLTLEMRCKLSELGLSICCVSFKHCSEYRDMLILRLNLALNIDIDPSTEIEDFEPLLTELEDLVSCFDSNKIEAMKPNTST